MNQAGKGDDSLYGEANLLKVSNNWPLRHDENPFEPKQIQAAWFLNKKLKAFEPARVAELDAVNDGGQLDGVTGIEIIIGSKEESSSQEQNPNVHVYSSEPLANEVLFDFPFLSRCYTLWSLLD